MADPPSKLTIKNETDGTQVVCSFNPKDLNLGKKVQWTPVNIHEGDVSKMNFSGGEPQRIETSLLFDTTGDEPPGDVRTKYTNFLLDLLKIRKQQVNGKDVLEPAHCRLSWGSLLSMACVLESIDLKFTFFKADGTPLRAEAKVKFVERLDESKQSGQNPTTRTEARKTRIVHEGERLDWIAYQEYGNSAHWRHLAETNNLADPGALRAGQILKIVPLP